MVQILPQASDFLNIPSHSFLHRVISVDSDSPESSIYVDATGCVGFGILAPQAEIHTFGRDNTPDGGWNMQKNGILIDGVSDADKFVSWADSGTVHWSAGLLRNESGEFWYLRHIEGNIAPFTISGTGRIGINSFKSQVNYHVSLVVGTGINDITIGGVYEQNYSTVYEIEVLTQNGGGTPDVMQWRKSTDDGETFTDYTVQNRFNASLTQSNFDKNISCAFETINGHTVGDKWRFVGFPRLPEGSFTISPMALDELQSTSDYTSSTFVDRTADANTTGSLDITLFDLGTNNSAFYVGAKLPINSLYFDIITPGVGVVPVLEFWDGISWNEITEDMGLIDNTLSFTRNGSISMNPGAFSNFGLYNPVNNEDSYILYWIRIRHTGNITTCPVVNNVCRHGDLRFGIFQGAEDSAPIFKVDSSGKVFAEKTIESKQGFILTSPNGSRWNIQVDNAGLLSTLPLPL